MPEHTPPQAVVEAAQRAVTGIEEGRAGKGFTETGEHRAHQLAAREGVDDVVIGKMKRYFARHRHDREVAGFSGHERGYPTPGRAAWDAWGGDAGRDWVAQERFADL